MISVEDRRRCWRVESCRTRILLLERRAGSKERKLRVTERVFMRAIWSDIRDKVMMLEGFRL